MNKLARRPFVAGNWKMNLTKAQALDLAAELKRLLARIRQVDIAVVPSALMVDAVAHRLDDSNIMVGVQNIYNAGFGAFTGENSAKMLAGVGASWCLVGHSERRHVFGETIPQTNQKVKDLLAEGLKVILCIGEKIEEREAGRTTEVLEAQLAGGLKDITPEQAADLVIAYEPVWAIGTGKTATVEMVKEVHTWVRAWLKEFFGDVTGNTIRIQYGGSVTAANAAELLAVEDVDGALVGGASLKAESFAEIVKAAL